jgi:hypothetical protein
MIIRGDFNIPLNIYKPLPPARAGHTFSHTPGTQSETDHVLGLKTNLNLNFHYHEVTEIIQRDFHDHNGIKSDP